MISRNGKICYLELPASDVKRSADFYRSVFGWSIRTRGDGATAFDDGVEVSGTWVSGRAPANDPSLLIYIMVKSVADTCDAIVSNGGEIVERHNEREILARFRDPAGNVLGLYQERALS